MGKPNTYGLYKLRPKIEERVTVGSLLYRNEAEKRIIKNKLLVEFNGKVKFTDGNGFIVYEHKERIQAI